MTRKLNDWIESYLEYTENSEPPDLYKEWIAVSVIASVLQRKCFLRWGPIIFYPNMYIVLVGPSGKCRKGTAMNDGAKFLEKLGIKTAAEAITREALIKELNERSNQSIDPKTGEILMHASLTIYSQELTVFLGQNNQQLMSDITDWYDCRNRWKYRTKNMGTDDIVGVWVNLIGATTPDLIQSALPADAIGGGLSSRIIFVYEENKGKLIPFPFQHVQDKKLKEDLIFDLEEIHMTTGEFSITEDFIDLYGDWYIDQAVNHPFQNNRNFSGYVDRRATHVLKLCVILSASYGSNKAITRETLERAIDLLERTEVKMGRVFSGYGTSSIAQLLGRIMDHFVRSGEITKPVLLATSMMFALPAFAQEAPKPDNSQPAQSMPVQDKAPTTDDKVRLIPNPVLAEGSRVVVEMFCLR